MSKGKMLYILIYTTTRHSKICLNLHSLLSFIALFSSQLLILPQTKALSAYKQKDNYSLCAKLFNQTLCII